MFRTSYYRCVCAYLLTGTLLCAPQLASALDVGVGLRAGTLGVGGDVDFGVNSFLTARIGFSGFSLDHTVDTSDATYSGKLKLSIPSAMLDVFPFANGFRFTGGVIVTGPKIDAVGRPASGGVYTLNGNQYTSSELTSLTGELKFNNSVAPYLGLGYGNVAAPGNHFTFLFDLGATYGGKPDVTLNAACSPSVPSAVCEQLATDVDAERLKLQSDVSILKWYPVVSLGLGYRF
jgi:hypothetical protein